MRLSDLFPENPDLTGMSEEGIALLRFVVAAIPGTTFPLPTRIHGNVTVETYGALEGGQLDITRNGPQITVDMNEEDY